MSPSRMLLCVAALAAAACGSAGAPDAGSHWPARDAAVEPDAGAPAQPDAGGREIPDGAVRVGTFNVHRFFDTVCDTGNCALGAYEEQPSQAAFDAKADQVAAGVRGMASTVVLLEEIETQTCLDALTQRLAPDYPVAVLGEINEPASVDVAVLARGDLLEVVRHRDQILTRPDGSTTTFTREFLEVHLQIAGARVIVFASHFRSKVNDDPGRRLAEAQAAAQIVESVAAAHPEAVVVMGGDLNDVPGSAPLQALEGSGELLRVASDQPEIDQVTYEYNGTRTAIDHLLFDQHASGHYLPHSAHVVRNFPQGGPYAGSDHAALTADFALP